MMMYKDEIIKAKDHVKSLEQKIRRHKADIQDSKMFLKQARQNKKWAVDTLKELRLAQKLYRQTGKVE